MRTKYDSILSYEELFAESVAMKMEMMEPKPLWRYLVPFMFLFEHIKRKKGTRIYSGNVLFIKKLALAAADDINRGEERQNRLTQIEDAIKDRLITQKVFSGEIHQKQMAEVNLLIDHYCKLLSAEGDSYYSLARNAYRTRSNYQSFLRQITSVEKAIDQAVTGILGETEKVRQSMVRKQTAISEMRAKRIDRIFLEIE